MMFFYTLAAAAVAYLLGSGGRGRMERRIEELERKLGGAAPAAEAEPAPPAAETARPAPVPEPAPPQEPSPEIIAVISAAVAAFLGKKARVKRVRQLHSTGINPWTQQGRVHIQGSHNLAARRGGE